MNTEYGIKIKSFEAKSLYEYNLGINFKYEWNYAVLTNSLLLDFLKENGLRAEDNLKKFLKDSQLKKSGKRETSFKASGPISKGMTH